MNAATFDYEATETGLAHYLLEIRRATPTLLTAEQERELGTRIQQGDRDALHTLIERNLRLVVDIAKKYHRDGVMLSDLIQEGNLGLMRAAQKYDPTRGIRFSTYATWWIRQGVTRFLNERATPIHVPTHIAESAQKLRKVRLRLLVELEREPDTCELAVATGMDRERIRFIRGAIHTVFSLDDLLAGDDPDEAGATLGSFIPSPEEEVDDQIISTEFKETIEAALRTFPLRTADILRKRIGLDGEKLSLEEVSKVHHITRERVRQLEERAMPLLRARLRGLEVAS